MLVPEINAREAQRLLAGNAPLRLIDVREADEWALCHLPGATLIPLSEWPAAVKDHMIDLHEPLIVYCHHGGRSQRAAQHLLHCGFTNVSNLAGGIDAWALEIDPQIPRY